MWVSERACVCDIHGFEWIIRLVFIPSCNKGAPARHRSSVYVCVCFCVNPRACCVMAMYCELSWSMWKTRPKIFSIQRASTISSTSTPAASLLLSHHWRRTAAHVNRERKADYSWVRTIRFLSNGFWWLKGPIKISILLRTLQAEDHFFN